MNRSELRLGMRVAVVNRRSQLFGKFVRVSDRLISRDRTVPVEDEEGRLMYAFPGWLMLPYYLTGKTVKTCGEHTILSDSFELEGGHTYQIQTQVSVDGISWWGMNAACVGRQITPDHSGVYDLSSKSVFGFYNRIAVTRLMK